MALNKSELLKLMKATAKADRSAPVAYSFKGTNYSYDELNETLRKELNEYAGSYQAYRENKNMIFSLIEQTLTDILPKKETIFTLKVSGLSMINVGILDGDIVIVQKQKTANNGDIVVAMTEENEVTLKRFFKEEDHIRLQPENDQMDPIILPTCTILGKAIGLYRKF